MVNEVLTHSWEVGWAAAKPFANRVRPDQPQAAVVGLWLGSPPTATKEAAGSEPSRSLWPTQQLRLSHPLG